MDDVRNSDTIHLPCSSRIYPHLSLDEVGVCDDPVPMDHPSSQCDGKMEISVSSVEGKGMNAACFQLQFSPSAKFNLRVMAVEKYH